jgi:transposase InsO family protein
MFNQLHKRLPREFIEGLLEAFNEHRIGEDRACQVLGIGRAQLYKLRRRWLRCVIGHHPFTLYARKESAFHRLPEEVERWLHEELVYIQRQAEVFRGRFNFAVLAEEAEKKFGHPFHRETFRYFALRHGYYHAQPEEKRKVYVRFETPGPGFLFQHDCSKHRWVPALGGYQHVIATKDDYSRVYVGSHLAERETSFAHLLTARRTVEQYGRPQAYYVDQNKVFRFVEHQGVHVRYSLGPDEGEVQFKRALRSLDIGLIYTEEGSPESKGKIEKSFGYLQRRVPYLCERYHIRSLREAQPILQEAVQFYNEKHVHEETGQIPNERWKAAIQDGKSYLRPLLETDLDQVFSLHYERRVKKDGTFSFRGKEYKLRHCAGAMVTLCLIPDQKLIVTWNGQRVGNFPF